MVSASAHGLRAVDPQRIGTRLVQGLQIGAAQDLLLVDLASTIMVPPVSTFTVDIPKNAVTIRQPLWRHEQNPKR